MNTLVGRTFSYRSHGKEVIRKVIKHFQRGGKRIYELLDPQTHIHHEALADVFDRTFKHKLAKVNRNKHEKGQVIRGKQMQNIFE